MNVTKTTYEKLIKFWGGKSYNLIVKSFFQCYCYHMAHWFMHNHDLYSLFIILNQANKSFLVYTTLTNIADFACIKHVFSTLLRWRGNIHSNVWSKAYKYFYMYSFHMIYFSKPNDIISSPIKAIIFHFSLYENQKYI